MKSRYRKLRGMKKIMPLLFLAPLSTMAASTASQFNGDFIRTHSVEVVIEDKKVENVEDTVKIQSTSDTEAQILIDTYSGNFHACQLVGKANVEGDFLVFKSQVTAALNRGKKAQCLLKISKPNADKTVTIEDQDDLCKLKFCGQQAELSGQFKVKPPVKVQDKN